MNSAYGFLLSQFTSAKHNKRTDKYGGRTVSTRVQIIVDIGERNCASLFTKIIHFSVNAIREHIPKGNTFLLGIKLNATEFLFDSGAEGANYAAEMAEYFEVDKII